MQLSEMHFSEEASRQLSQMKGRTGLTPNILARIGFCLSLENPTLPDPAEYEGSGHISIKRHVLTGPYDVLFVAMLKERCDQDQLCDEQMTSQFKAHMNRGIFVIAQTIENIDDLLLSSPANYR